MRITVIPLIEVLSYVKTEKKKKKDETEDVSGTVKALRVLGVYEHFSNVATRVAYIDFVETKRS